MAYTYQEFLNAANGSGVMDKFSQQDLTVAQKNPEYGLSMVSLMKDISGATTAEQRLLATEAANQLRKNYGIYNAGGSFGSTYGSAIQKAKDQLDSFDPFSYGKETEYQKLLDSVNNYRPFSYDQANDPSYSAFKKSYMREGERASANALAQASAASGGQVSSFASQAAQQAANYYAGQLSDIVPTLEQNAYQKYLNDFSNEVNRLSVLENDRNTSYQQYLAKYDQLRNNLNYLLQQEASDYQKYLDQMEQQRLAEQTAYERALMEEQLAYDRAKAQYNLLGYATPEIAAILGIPEPEPVAEVHATAPYAGPTGPLADPGNHITDGERSYLLSRYPDGVIKNTDTWNNLVSRFGAESLAASGLYGPDGAGSIPSWQVNELKTMYPGGAVDSYTWNGLLGMYSAEALAAAGIYPVQQQTQNQTVTPLKKESTGKKGMVTFS